MKKLILDPKISDGDNRPKDDKTTLGQFEVK